MTFQQTFPYITPRCDRFCLYPKSILKSSPGWLASLHIACTQFDQAFYLRLVPKFLCCYCWGLSAHGFKTMVLSRKAEKDQGCKPLLFTHAKFASSKTTSYHNHTERRKCSYHSSLVKQRQAPCNLKVKGIFRSNSWAQNPSESVCQYCFILTFARPSKGLDYSMSVFSTLFLQLDSINFKYWRIFRKYIQVKKYLFQKDIITFVQISVMV